MSSANFGNGIGEQGFGKMGTANFEPQRVYNFSLAIDGLADTVFALESMSLPTKMVSEIELNFMNTRRYVAGRASFDSIPVIVKDTIQGSTADEINQWHQSVFDPATGGIGLANQYKRNATIFLYSPEGSVSRSWTLEGCFPTAVNFGSLTYDSDDVVRVDMQLRFDRCFANFGGISGLSSIPTPFGNLPTGF